MSILDFHCHIYPDKIAEKAAEATGAFYGTGHPKGLGTVSDLCARGEAAGISMQLIHSVATTPAQVSSINRFIAASVEGAPEHFIGFGALHPDSEHQETDVQQIIDLGLRGIKLHPDIQKFALNEPRSMQMFEANAGRLPILLHTGDNRYHYSNPEQLIPVLEAFPDTVFIGAHMVGYTVWDQAYRDIYRKYPNLWTDCSSTRFCMEDDRFVELIRSFGTERVMFGTDYPMWDPVEEVQHFMDLPLLAAEKEQILWKNACRLLRLI